MIRTATLSDIDGIVELAKHFYGQMEGGRFSEKIFRPNIRMLIKSENSIVILCEHDGKISGALIGVIDRLWYSEDFVAHDLAFAVKPKASGLYAWLMAKQFIRWAKSKPNVVDITMQVSSGLGEAERVGALYEALGMKKMGGCYSLFVGDGRRQ